MLLLEHIPMKIGHGYRPIEVLDMQLLYQPPFSEHRRLRVFALRGCLCYICEKREGIYLIKAQHFTGGVHIDVYTEDFHLMTIDHLIPKSKGGTDNIQNLFPCCDKCNTKKSNKLIVRPAREGSSDIKIF